MNSGIKDKIFMDDNKLQRNNYLLISLIILVLLSFFGPFLASVRKISLEGYRLKCTMNTFKRNINAIFKYYVRLTKSIFIAITILPRLNFKLVLNKRKNE